MHLLSHPSKNWLSAIVAFGLCLSGGAWAHRVADPLEAAPHAAAAGSPVERVSGIVHRVTIDDRVAGVVIEHIALELDAGGAVTLKGADANLLPRGARVEATGQRNGKALFVSGVRTLALPSERTLPSQKAKPLQSVKGKLALLHADNFDDGRSRFIFEVHDAEGGATVLKFQVIPEALQSGMQVVVAGQPAADGSGVEPETVTILALPAIPVSKALEKALKVNNVLVILMTFTDSPGVLFTQAQVQSVFAGGPGSSSVTEYFKEASFGQQLLNATITNWLPTNAATPGGCDWQQMGALGRNAAIAAGYNPANYSNVVYVFPSAGACGWAGLAYVGASGVWINGRNATSVYGHELGHNFGLLHAASLRCGGVAIGGACSVSEYGDPFDIMGNQSAMHFNAAQKLDLGWIPASAVKTLTGSGAMYTLAPLETAGGNTYGVRVAAPIFARRDYWIEYRQPVGFDNKGAPYTFNGALIRVGSPFETLCSGCDAYSDDTELLDMTPLTATFADATLGIGNAFVDLDTGMTVNVLSEGAGLTLSVQVTAPAARLSDLSGEGRSDILWYSATNGATVAWLMNGTAPASSGLLAADPDWRITHLADFNGDGKTDVVWRQRSTGATAIRLMAGVSAVSSTVISTDDSWVIYQIGDFNGDGKADIVWRNTRTGVLVIWLMDGPQPIASSFLSADLNWTITHVADFNGDGKADLLWRNMQTGETVLWLMNGASPMQTVTLSTNPDLVPSHVGDLDGDGKSDIVWRDTSSGATAIWLMNGIQVKASATVSTDPAMSVTHLADLNGDGKKDLLWVNSATGVTSAMLMNGTVPTASAVLSSNSSMRVLHVGDLDGDGKADIIWQNTSTGGTIAWLMNGVVPVKQSTLSTNATWQTLVTF